MARPKGLGHLPLYGGPLGGDKVCGTGLGFHAAARIKAKCFKTMVR